LVILLRAGLELSKDTLNGVGMRALLMSCVPAVLEGVAITLLAPHFLGLSYMDSALLAAILAAVSPAVVVPLMLQFMDQGKGSRKGIPTLILFKDGAEATRIVGFRPKEILQEELLPYIE